MAEVVQYVDFLNKKTDKVDKKIEVLIEETEEIVEDTINEICDYILFEMETDDIPYDEILKDLRDSIDDWFNIQEKKKGKGIWNEFRRKI